MKTKSKAFRAPNWLLAAGACLALIGCADDEIILDGERLDVGAPTIAGAIDLNAVGDGEIDPSFTTPETTKNTSWTHRAGSATHFAGHPAFTTAPQLVWSVNIGQGNSRKHRVTSQPVIADGRIYTMDSLSKVTAVSTGGAVLWSRNLTPANEREGDASGGGVAVSDGRVYATTGFGEVIALDAASGAEIWRQRLEAPATASPTVVGDLVYVVGRDNRAWAVETGNGRIKWELPGTPDISGVVGGAAPAVTDRVAVFPLGSGELVAVLRQGGVRLWGSAVSGKRTGRPYANITDITADPVVVDNVIYTGNQSGRAVALSLTSGQRIWTAREGAYGPVAVADNSVFMISDQSELIRLTADTGQTVWKVELPFFRREKARRSKAIFAHYGPVLAGGRLWVASDTGTLKAYDPETGDELGSTDIPGGAASAMSVANGVMYLISGRGQLHAFR